MINTLKKSFFICLLLLASSQHILCNQSDENVFIALAHYLFGSNKPTEHVQKNDTQLPESLPVEDYINQFEHDLIGAYRNYSVIPERNVKIMKQMAHQQLQYINRNNAEQVNQTLRNVILEHIKQETNNKLAQRFLISSANKQSIATSIENNAIARLTRMPNINGEALAEFFGKAHTQLIDQLVTTNTTYAAKQQSGTQGTFHTQQPEPSAPTATYASQDTECPICYESFSNNKITNPCGHVICSLCFSQYNKICAICRAPIN